MNRDITCSVSLGQIACRNAWRQIDGRIAAIDCGCETRRYSDRSFDGSNPVGEQFRSYGAARAIWIGTRYSWM
jgi:hypothetical protein